MIVRGQEWTQYDEERLQQLEQLSKDASRIIKEKEAYEEQRGMRLLQELTLKRQQDASNFSISGQDTQARYDGKASSIRITNSEDDSRKQSVSLEERRLLNLPGKQPRTPNEQGKHRMSDGENQPTCSVPNELLELSPHVESSNLEWEELTPGDYESPMIQPCNTPPELQDMEPSFGSLPFRTAN